MGRTPRLIQGGTAVDDRGSLSFVNDFDFEGVKRFYQVFNFSTSVIRAFHGHRREAKYVYVPEGSALVVAVSLDVLENSGGSGEAPVEGIHRFVLSSRRPAVLFVPENHANGFRALEEGTIIQFFSTRTLGESEEDDIRFPYDVVGKEVWEVENR
jgi:dTDP-4-dehydrorhamnose 3,5-epimerase